MSIRLRLTLLYTVILALTLAVLGGILYGTQLQSIRRGGERMLSGLAQRLVERRQSGDTSPSPPPPPPSEAWREEGAERRFGDRLMYTQLTNLDGQILARSEDLGEVTLPLSAAGLEQVGQGEPWSEVASVEGQRLLIYSAPVVVAGEVVEIVQVAHSIAGEDQYLAAMRRNLLIGGGLAVAGAFGAGWLLSGVVLRPIHRITQTAQTIGVERDLSRRVQYAGPNDELGQLATTFNDMLAELEIVYQQQRQFVADVSHELRTPLTTIRGNLELLRREPPISAEDRVEILSDVTEESERLIRLVNDLLMLAHADARQPPRREPIPVVALVEDVCRQARYLAPERSIHCIQLPDVQVLGDRDALKQILLILVDNALKHTLGEITVTAQVVDNLESVDGDEGVAISVRDTGPGIQPELQPHLFERFHRGAHGAGREGSGLGLAIAKALIEAQDGCISVESQVEQGSVFTVTLTSCPSRTHDRYAHHR